VNRGFVRGLVLAGALSALGCAVPVAPMSGSTRGGDPAEVRAALDRAGEPGPGPVNGSGHAMAFVVLARADGGGAAELHAYDLDSRSSKWRAPVDVTGRVAVSRPTVVYGDRSGALVARDVASGAIKWQKSLDRAFTRIGYAAGGDTVAEVVQAAGKSGADARDAAVVAYDAASGSRRFSRDLEGPVGAPVVWGELVVVPRQSQWVTLLDGKSGQLLADLLSREEAATFVRGLPEGLFFGSQGVFRASEQTAIARRKSSGYTQAKLPEFVRPLYHHDMYRPAENGYSAIDRNRLLWRGAPGRDAAAKFLDGLVVVHNFRFFFGIDAASGELRWAYNQLRNDAIASAHTGPAIVYVTSDGYLRALSAGDGKPAYEAALPGAGAVSVIGATFDADGFAPTGTVAGSNQSLPQVLSSIVSDPDRRFSDVRLFALDQLTKQGGPDVTRELLRTLDSGDVVPTPVLKRAMEVLVARKDPQLLPVFIEALKVHPDYAEDRAPKRLEFYARAVAELKAKEAVPLLVEHLRLPDTDLDAVREIAEAALALEAKEALEPFQDFLLQYRADPAFTGQPGPLTAVANVLLRLGGPKERSTLLFVAEEPQTLEALGTHIKRALASAAPAEAAKPEK
jgi:outer membrane protein assembly factor BamB